MIQSHPSASHPDNRPACRKQASDPSADSSAGKSSGNSAAGDSANSAPDTSSPHVSPPDISPSDISPPDISSGDQKQATPQQLFPVPLPPLLPTVASVSSAEAISLALPPPQRAAIEMLTSGHSMIESATAAGVNRTTLYRWLKNDPNFKAAYNAWQHDALATARGKVLALTDAAVDAVRRALTKGDAKTALVILKSTGILDRPEPGSTDPDEIKTREAIERKQSDTDLFFDELQAGFPSGRRR